MKLKLAMMGVLLVAVLMLSACPSDSNVLRQAAVAAKDASSAVAAFQDAEISSYQSGLVDVQDHQAIQILLLDVASVGKALNNSLRAANDNPSAVKAITIAVAQLDELQKSGALHIKNKDTLVKWNIAMIGARTALNTISAMLEAK